MANEIFENFRVLWFACRRWVWKLVLYNLSDIILTFPFMISIIFSPLQVLPCLHTFCERCLESYIPEESLTLSCPVCRQQSILPKQGVAALQTNFMISSLMEMLDHPSQCQRLVSPFCNSLDNYQEKEISNKKKLKYS